MLTTVKDAVRRTRQHHAIEHATLHLLAARLPGRRMAGYSDAGGFTIFGDVPFDQVRRAVSDALLHLQAGESSLAIHPNCGTNLAVTGIMATAAALAGPPFDRQRQADRARRAFCRLPAPGRAGTHRRAARWPIACRSIRRWPALATAGSSRSGPSQPAACTPIASLSTKRRQTCATVAGSDLWSTSFSTPTNTWSLSALADLKAALGDPELASLNIAELAPGQVDPVRLLAEAALMPFLAEKRLLIVRGYLDALDKRMAAAKAPGSAAFLEAADLLTRLPAAPETCDLVFVDAAVDKRRGLYKGFTLPAADGQPERKVPRPGGAGQGWRRAARRSADARPQGAARLDPAACACPQDRHPARRRGAAGELCRPQPAPARQRAGEAVALRLRPAHHRGRTCGRWWPMPRRR